MTWNTDLLTFASNVISGSLQKSCHKMKEKELREVSFFQNPLFQFESKL